MTNNKQQTAVKLYTEEQVFKAIQMADKYHYLITSEECDIVNSLTPIELPSDEEIWEAGNNEELNSKQYAFVRGAKWMRDKIQGGNK
jgi:hypothetical protein